MTSAILVLARTVHFGSAMLLFALPYFLLIILRPVFSTETEVRYLPFCRDMEKWLGVALCLEAISGGIWFWIIAAQKLNQSSWRAPSMADLGRVLGHTPFGHLWLLRAGIGLGLGTGLYLALRRKTFLPPRPSFLNGLILIFSGILLITLAWAGHAASGIHHQILHLLADTPHLLLGAIWPIGLVPMAYFLWRNKRADGGLPTNPEVKVLQRFSKTCLIAVLILVVTGSINGWLMIGSWKSLLTTAHGHLFLAKMAVVGLMVAMGAFCHLRLMPTIDAPDRVRTLERTLWLESSLAVVVVFIVGMHI
jgi:putative copper resistance protein D